MFGLNADAWLADHHRTHRQLVETATRPGVAAGIAIAIQPGTRTAPAATTELACC